jgi:hypothetical protein
MLQGPIGKPFASVVIHQNLDILPFLKD